MIPEIVSYASYGVWKTSTQTINLIAQNYWIIAHYHKNQISVLIIFISQDLSKIWQCILFKISNSTEFWVWQRWSKCTYGLFLFTSTMSFQVDAPKFGILPPPGKAAFSRNTFETIWNFLINASGILSITVEEDICVQIKGVHRFPVSEVQSPEQLYQQPPWARADCENDASATAKGERDKRVATCRHWLWRSAGTPVEPPVQFLIGRKITFKFHKTYIC